MSSSQTRTPGDYIGIGLAIMAVGIAAVCLAAAVTETAWVFWGCLVPIVAGAPVMLIGIVAWGVAVGIRTATADRQPVGSQR